MRIEVIAKKVGDSYKLYSCCAGMQNVSSVIVKDGVIVTAPPDFVIKTKKEADRIVKEVQEALDMRSSHHRKGGPSAKEMKMIEQQRKIDALKLEAAH